MNTPSQTSNQRREVEALVVGAGMGGISTLHKLVERGVDAVLIDKASGVGGTWFWNRYPGAKSDTESQLYQLPGDVDLYRATTWRKRYATAEEIRQYLNDAIDRWGLRGKIQLETELQSATFDEESGTWTVQTSRGEFRARFLINALGVLSAVNKPDFPGIDRFRGQVVHTAAYPEDLDLKGKRVGVIGNGSTGVQFMTEIAPVVGHLTSFQRTPQYSVPAANREYSDAEIAHFKQNVEQMWDEARNSLVGFGLDEVTRETFSVSAEERERIFEDVWTRGGNMAFLHETFSDLAKNRKANDEAANFLRRKIQSIVKDPDTARRLTPTEPYARRPICDSGYFEIFNRQNVELVSLRETPIDEFVEDGVRTQDGTVHRLDVLVMATGFDAVDGNYRRVDIRGREGRTLASHWSEGARSRFGVSVSGFPNMFMVLGPNGPFVNLPMDIDAESTWVADTVGWLHEQVGATLELRAEAEQEWLDICSAELEGSLFLETASWIFGANIPGKRKSHTVNWYTGGLAKFRGFLERESASGYRSYRLDVPASAVA